MPRPPRPPIVLWLLVGSLVVANQYKKTKLHGQKKVKNKLSS